MGPLGERELADVTVAFAKLYEERFGKGCGLALELFAGFKRFRNTTPMAYLVLRTDQTSGLEAKAVICIPAVPLIKHANRTSRILQNTRRDDGARPALADYGKSTLMNILSGLLRPNSGEVRAGDQRLEISSPRDAILNGIGMVHRAFHARSGSYGRRERGSRRHSLAQVEGSRQRRCREDRRLVCRNRNASRSKRPGYRYRGWSPSNASRSLKTLSRGARVLILDEPTTVLTDAERSQLYDVIRKLRAGGTAIILISHKLDDIYGVCDRVVVLRRGRVVDAAPISQRNADDLIRGMIGDDPPPLPPRSIPRVGVPTICVRDLAVRRQSGALAFEGISFDLHEGEILALAGVEGNGQEELADALMGLRPTEAGSISFLGRQLGRNASTRARRKMGLHHIPHDRSSSGVLLRQQLTENMLLSHSFNSTFNRYGWIDRRRVRKCVSEIANAFDLSRGRGDIEMGSLWGEISKSW